MATSTLLAGDARGRVWQLNLLDSEQSLHSYNTLAEVEGGAVTALAAAAPGLVAAGTSVGALLLLQRDSASEGSWRAARCCQLDGPVLRVQADAEAEAAVAATATGTLWQAGVARGGAVDQQPRVLLCGQQHGTSAWAYSAGDGWRKGPALVSTAGPSGLSIWHAVSGAGEEQMGDAEGASWTP